MMANGLALSPQRYSGACWRSLPEVGVGGFEVPPLGADEADKPHRIAGFYPDFSINLRHPSQLLGGAVSHWNDHDPGIGQLFDQGVGYFRPAGSHHYGVIGSMFGPTQSPISHLA